MCFLFWSLGCALDCWPLSRHLSSWPQSCLTPSASCCPMATFHSHLFSIWIWHMHIRINTIHQLCLSESVQYKFKILFTRLQSCCHAAEHSVWICSWISWIQRKYVKCICQITPYVSVVGPVWFRCAVLWCEWSGYSFFFQQCMHSSSSAASGCEDQLQNVSNEWNNSIINLKDKKK